MIGKTGVAIAAGAPIVLSALEAAEGSIAQMRALNLGLLSTTKTAVYRFLNSITKGFNMGNIADNVGVYTTSGQNISVPVASGIPDGAWYKTGIVGGVLVGWDIAVSWLSSKLAKVRSGVRFMGVKLTGGK